MTAETGPARGHETGSDNRAAATQDDDATVPLSLFDKLDAAPTTATAVLGMRATLDSEGEFGRQVLRQIITETGRRLRVFGASDIDHTLVNPARPNALSATFGAMAREGLLREVGVRRSTRPEARRRLERTWSLTDGAR